MRSHLIEIGPNTIRRLCCGGAPVADAELERAAFENIDDSVALIDLQPSAVKALWKNIFQSLDCGTMARVTVVHPSWWSSRRLDVVGTAAQALVGEAEVRSRSWLLTRAAARDASTVEITDRFVVVTGDAMTVQTRCGDVETVAESVALSILSTGKCGVETVVVDAPATVYGARTLATAIASRLSTAGGVSAIVMDDIGLRRLVAELTSSAGQSSAGHRVWVSEKRLRALTSAVLVAGCFVTVSALHRRAAPSTTDQFPTTLVVEGQVALEVPAQWTTRRVVAGPGSARVQITSPADPEVALHVTQSRVAAPDLDATAEFLKSAIDAAPVGVFVDFNPAGRRAGHPVVTYREVRTGHDIRWTVWVDKAVRISIGCQSRGGRDDAVSRACELAVSSARAWI